MPLDLTKLRPADASSGAIREALNRARVARTQADTDAAAAKAARDGLLLDGDPAQLAKAEKAYAAQRDDAERVEAVVAQLAERLARAEQEETVGAVRERLAELAGVNRRANDWWKAKGATLTALLAEGNALADAQDTARGLLQNARHRAYERYQDEPRISSGGAAVEIEAAGPWAEAIRDARTPV